MSKAIVTKLNTLAAANRSQYATDIAVTQGSGDSYNIALGKKMGTFWDLIRVHKYLEEAGLSRNSLDPHVGDYGITTTAGHTTLGFGDGKGGMIDSVALSGNVTGTLTGETFGLKADFTDIDENEVLQKLDKAIHLQKMDADLKTERGAGKKQHVQRVRGLDTSRDQMATVDSFRKRKSEAQNVAIVRKFVEDAVHEVVPDAIVTVTYDRLPNPVTQMVYEMDKPTFEIAVDTRDPNTDNWKVMEDVNARIRDKMPYNPHLPVSGLSRSEGGGKLSGKIAGSAERVAAQIGGVDLSVFNR